MKHALGTLDLLRWGSLGVITFALFIGTWQMAADETGLPYRYWARYCASLERKMRSMFIFTPGRLIALGQLAVMFIILAAQLTMDLPMWWLLIAMTAILPSVYLEMESESASSKSKTSSTTSCFPSRTRSRRRPASARRSKAS